MTTLTLPNEIINKIFSYIEGKHNQIIKNGLTTTFWTNRDVSTFDMNFAFYMIRCNLLRDKNVYNHTVIEYDKYFKYTVLHRDRECLFYSITHDLRNLMDNFNYDDYYYNYYQIFKYLREKYIYEHNYCHNMIDRNNNINLRKHYITHFKYTVLHENRKLVFNDIKRYNTKKDDVCNKKLSANILLEQRILTNYNKKNNNKRQKKWN